MNPTPNIHHSLRGEVNEALDAALTEMEVFGFYEKVGTHDGLYMSVYELDYALSNPWKFPGYTKARKIIEEFRERSDALSKAENEARKAAVQKHISEEEAIQFERDELFRSITGYTESETYKLLPFTPDFGLSANLRAEPADIEQDKITFGGYTNGYERASTYEWNKGETGWTKVKSGESFTGNKYDKWTK